MKTLIFSLLVISYIQPALAKSFTCKSEPNVVVSVDGDVDQMTFSGEVSPAGAISDLAVTYSRMIERNLNPKECVYSLSFTGHNSASVSLFCPGTFSDREYITTARLDCIITN